MGCKKLTLEVKMHTKIIIELEFDERPTRKDVYDYILDLIGDDSLYFKRV